jgi:hypothetical protein
MTTVEWASLFSVAGFVGVVTLGIILVHRANVALTPLSQKRVNVVLVGGLSQLAAFSAIRALASPLRWIDATDAVVYASFAVWLVFAFVLGGLVRARE